MVRTPSRIFSKKFSDSCGTVFLVKPNECELRVDYSKIPLLFSKRLMDALV